MTTEMYKIGIDVGGTFTDFLLADPSGRFEVYKVPSTPADPSIGVVDGFQQMAERRGLELTDFIRQVEIIVHGTTVTTNAVLTGNGARTGLLTTYGFRDTLEMRRGIREEPFNNKSLPPEPLVPRYLRIPVRERVDHTGKARVALSEDDVRVGIRRFQEEGGVEAIAICFMHSYLDGAHEEAARKIISQAMPDAYLTTSSQLLPQIRFYDRISTTVLNSYVGPILRRYLTSLERRLEQLGFAGVLLIMQSNGGVTSVQVAIDSAATTLLSGPAAGPVAGMAYAGALGYDDCITVDMGGTSFDAALIKDRQPVGVSEGRIAGHLLALPMLGIYTIGAGGGSVGWLDEGGLLRMGPRSAGARPGPACYDLGGTEPTCTDADLLLGYLDPDYFLGGRMKLNRQNAVTAIEEKIARPLGLDEFQAAAGMYRVINVNMAAGVREVSVDRGFDPREFPLVVAGGAGPIHAGMIALELEIPVVVVPRESSIFCAAGMLLSDLKHDFVRTYPCPVPQLTPEKFRGIYDHMEDEARRVLRSENVAERQIAFTYACDIRYVGQYHEVTVPITRRDVDEAALDSIVAEFHRLHDRLYGYSIPGADVETINFRITGLGVTDKPELQQGRQRGGGDLRKARRQAYIPDEQEFRELDVFDGDMMGHTDKVIGPAIVEQVNTTLFVPPDYDVVCDRYGSFIMYLRSHVEDIEARVLR